MPKKYLIDEPEKLKPPRVFISPEPKSTFVDRNRHPDMRRNLGKFDYQDFLSERYNGKT